MIENQIYYPSLCRRDCFLEALDIINSADVIYKNNFSGKDRLSYFLEDFFIEKSETIWVAGRVTNISKNQLSIEDNTAVFNIDISINSLLNPSYPEYSEPLEGVATCFGKDGTIPTMKDLNEIFHYLKAQDIVQLCIEISVKKDISIKKIGILTSSDTCFENNKDRIEEINKSKKINLDTIKQRSCIIDAIRCFFKKSGFLEIETPILAVYPGLEPHIDPLVSSFRSTPYEQFDRFEPIYLLSSPEYAMKRFLVEHPVPIYQISKVFRNGELGALHSPEFSMIEWYRPYSSIKSIQSDVENLVHYIFSSKELNISKKENILYYQNNSIDMKIPWKTITVKEAFKLHSEIVLDESESSISFAKKAINLGINFNKPIEEISWEEVFFQILTIKIEPNLGFDKPVFLTEYPSRFAALSKTKLSSSGNDLVAERFELYIAGIELANAYSELNDPLLQIDRFKEEQKERKNLRYPVFDYDIDYINALKQGLPPTGGIALGIDRLIMILLNFSSIEDVMLFPFKNTKR